MRFIPVARRRRIPRKSHLGETAVLNVKFDEDLGAAIDRAARRKKTSRAALVRAAVVSYLEDLADVRDVKAALKEGGRPVSLPEVKRRLGL